MIVGKKFVKYQYTMFPKTGHMISSQSSHHIAPPHMILVAGQYDHFILGISCNQKNYVIQRSVPKPMFLKTTTASYLVYPAPKNPAFNVEISTSPKITKALIVGPPPSI